MAKKKKKYSKVLVALLVLSIFVFTGVMIAVFVRTRDVPDSLVYSFFGAITGELGWLAGIKRQETKVIPEDSGREDEPYV